jgi:hypothetical protein
MGAVFVASLVRKDRTMKTRFMSVVAASAFLGSFSAVAVFLCGGFMSAWGEGAGVPCCNGDVNADTTLNTADAIYLLQYLFANGPAPVPIERCCALPSPGDTGCYDAWGNVVACDDPEWPGQAGFYQKGCSNDPRFVDNGDGTVTDTCTCLMWLKSTEPGTYTWQEALKHCESLEYAGHDDWRLPNGIELRSIVNYGRVNPAAYPEFSLEQSWHWNSGSYAGAPSAAGIMDFGIGEHSADIKTEAYHVVACRDAAEGR